MLLKGKRILLGLCGGIAAYKSLSLIRLLKKEGAEVRCVCTPAALEFYAAEEDSIEEETPAQEESKEE